jgi:hypothetical protein
VGSVRNVDHVGIVDAVFELLADALKETFGAGALDLCFDAGIFLLERRCDLLSHLDVDGRVIDNRALLLSRLDEPRRDRHRLGWCSHGPWGSEGPDEYCRNCGNTH